LFFWEFRIRHIVFVLWDVFEEITYFLKWVAWNVLKQLVGVVGIVSASQVIQFSIHITNNSIYERALIVLFYASAFEFVGQE
jgi:hypothetical protein